MRTGRIVLYGLLGSLATFWAASCQGPQEFFRDNALSSGTGGAPGTGGTLTGSGGSGTGGVTATGGSPATGGVPGTGGIVATGGVTGTGGIVATGGVPGTGGIVATGGVPGTGGIVATGGVPGTGGIVATGGVPGTGGIVATGGVPGTGGAAGSSGAKNCADAIKLAGYSAGTRAAVQRLQGKRRRQVGELHEGHRLPRHELSLRLEHELRAQLQQHGKRGQRRNGLRERAPDRRQLRSAVAHRTNAKASCVIASASCAPTAVLVTFGAMKKTFASFGAAAIAFCLVAAWRAPISTCRGRARSPRSCRRSG